MSILPNVVRRHLESEVASRARPEETEAMRFMTMHKVTAELEKGLPPDPESLGAIGALMEEAAKSGIFVGGDGLRPTSERLHIRYANGERTITRGPFEE